MSAIIFSIVASLIFVVVKCENNESEVQLPTFMKICSKNDENLNECIRDSLQTLIPNFKNGAPEFNLQPLDPYFVGDIHFDYDRNNIKVKAIFKNIVCHGISSITVKAVRANVSDPSQIYIEVDVSYPQIILEVNYKADGHFLAIPLLVKGYSNITMADVSTTWKISGNKVLQNGKEHIQIKHFQMHPDIGSMKVYASDITGNQEFDETALQILNELWPLFYNQMLPSIEKEWDPVMSATANKIFLHVPFDRLFL